MFLVYAREVLGEMLLNNLIKITLHKLFAKNILASLIQGALVGTNKPKGTN